MSRRTSGPARWRMAVVCALVVLTTSGCGDDPSPSESVPALGAGLDRVDADIEAGEPDKARKAVEDLIAATAQARVNGDLSDEEADRIFEAAQDVLAQLPEDGGDIENDETDETD